MEKAKIFTHFRVKGKSGVDYLCPVETDAAETDLKKLDLNVCFEKDVPGRYAARVIIKDS